MCEYVSRLTLWLLELNLFKSDSNDEKIIKKERQSTRIYLVIFIIASVIFITYTALAVETVQVQVIDPSFSTYENLERKYSTTIKCFCSRTAVKYADFMEVRIEYHPICSSSFVEDQWIIDSYRYQSATMWPMDIRTVMSAHAQFLQTFCQNSKHVIAYSLIGLGPSSIISNVLMTPSLLNIQIDIQKHYLQSASAWGLSVLISFYKLVTASDRLITGLGTNAFFTIPLNQSLQATVGINAYQLTNNATPCYCLAVDSCAMPGQFYSTNKFPTFGFYRLDTIQGQSIPVEGIRVGCFALDSLSSSTLQCYYNRSCLDLLVSNSTPYTALSSSSTNEYPMDTVIESIVNRLFIKQWLFNTSYNNYYSRCAPSACTYSITRRSNILIILVTIFSTIGGLNTILRVLAPSLTETIETIRNGLFSRHGPRESTITIPWLERPTLRSRIKNGLTWFWKKIYLLNLFDSQSKNSLQERQERQTTRLYILFLLITFIALVLFTALTKENKIYTVVKPTQTIYDTLYAQHADTIECTCDRIAIPYSIFLNVEATYHQICSSDFISPSFVGQLYGIRQDLRLYRGDFVQFAPGYFQWLMTLCILSHTVFDNELVAFQAELLVNTKLLSRFTFANRTDQLIDGFIHDVQYYFARSIRNSREFLGLLQPLSATYTLTYDLPIIRTSSNRQVRIEPSNFLSNCSCMINPITCSMPAAFYSWDSTNATYILSFQLDGIRLGCNSIESVLQSNLACWYSDDCYQKVVSFWQNRTYSFVGFPSVLNIEVKSRFNASASVQSIVQGLMLESWLKNVTYESYFDYCAPQYCTYSVTERRAVLFLITTLLGLFGGLNLVLRLLTPWIVRTVYSWITRRQHVFGFIKDLLQTIPIRIAQLNVFYKPNRSTPLTLDEERRSTRIHLTLFSFFMISLFIYYSVTQYAETVIHFNPTEDLYRSLRQSSLISSLLCPCTHIAVPYSTFLQAETTIHPICSSPFIEQPWIENIYSDGNWSKSNPNNFHSRGALYFAGLRIFCQSFYENASHSISEFLSNNLISSHVIFEMELYEQVNDTIERNQVAIREDFSGMSLFGDRLGNINQILTVYSLNWIISPIPNNVDVTGLPLPMEPVAYGNCSCATSSQCSQPVMHHGEVVPGFFIACSPFRTIFQSSLVCLYNATCLSRINEKNLTISPLVLPSNSEKYPINRTIEELLKNAFDQAWIVQTNYSLYFQQCRPISCSYSMNQRRSLLQILVTLLGFYGGLSVALRFTIPFISRFIWH